MLVINPNDISATVRSCYALCSESVKGRSDFLSPGGRKPLNAEEARAVAAGIVGFVENRCDALTRAYYRFMFARNLNLLAEQAVLVECARSYIYENSKLKALYQDGLMSLLLLIPEYLRSVECGSEFYSKRDLVAFSGIPKTSFNRVVYPEFVEAALHIKDEVIKSDDLIAAKIERSLGELNNFKKYA